MHRHPSPSLRSPLNEWDMNYILHLHLATAQVLAPISNSELTYLSFSTGSQAGCYQVKLAPKQPVLLWIILSSLKTSLVWIEYNTTLVQYTVLQLINGKNLKNLEYFESIVYDVHYIQVSTGSRHNFIWLYTLSTLES